MILALLLASALTKSIASGNQEWIDGLKARDPALMAAAYDEDAINCNAAGECVHGHAGIEKQMAARVAKLGTVTSAWVKSARTVPDGDLAYEWGRAGFRMADGKEFAGRYVTVWRRQADGSWKILHNVSLPARAAAAPAGAAH